MKPGKSPNSNEHDSLLSPCGKSGFHAYRDPAPKGIAILSVASPKPSGNMANMLKAFPEKAPLCPASAWKSFSPDEWRSLLSKKAAFILYYIRYCPWANAFAKDTDPKYRQGLTASEWCEILQKSPDILLSGRDLPAGTERNFYDMTECLWQEFTASEWCSLLSGKTFFPQKTSDTAIRKVLDSSRDPGEILYALFDACSAAERFTDTEWDFVRAGGHCALFASRIPRLFDLARFRKHAPLTCAKIQFRAAGSVAAISAAGVFLCAWIAGNASVLFALPAFAVMLLSALTASWFLARTLFPSAVGILLAFLFGAASIVFPWCAAYAVRPMHILLPASAGILLVLSMVFRKKPVTRGCSAVLSALWLLLYAFAGVVICRMDVGRDGKAVQTRCEEWGLTKLEKHVVSQMDFTELWRKECEAFHFSELPEIYRHGKASLSARDLKLRWDALERYARSPAADPDALLEALENFSENPSVHKQEYVDKLFNVILSHAMKTDSAEYSFWMWDAERYHVPQEIRTRMDQDYRKQKNARAYHEFDAIRKNDVEVMRMYAAGAAKRLDESGEKDFLRCAGMAFYRKNDLTLASKLLSDAVPQTLEECLALVDSFEKMKKPAKALETCRSFSGKEKYPVILQMILRLSPDEEEKIKCARILYFDLNQRSDAECRVIACHGALESLETMREIIRRLKADPRDAEVAARFLICMEKQNEPENFDAAYAIVKESAYELEKKNPVLARDLRLALARASFKRKRYQDADALYSALVIRQNFKLEDSDSVNFGRAAWETPGHRDRPAVRGAFAKYIDYLKSKERKEDARKACRELAEAYGKVCAAPPLTASEDEMTKALKKAGNMEKESVKWLQEAVTLGDAEAPLLLAMYYFQSENMDKDDTPFFSNLAAACRSKIVPESFLRDIEFYCMEDKEKTEKFKAASAGKLP